MKKTNNSKCWEDAGKKEPSYDVSGNVKSWNCYKNQYGGSPKIK
jgi:hypothetical protein